MIKTKENQADKDRCFTSSYSADQPGPNRRRAKSLSNLSKAAAPKKSYENITHTNYVQMVNSMITSAISDIQDPEYVEYVTRHIQGLFENFTPILLKSKSNEEMLINSASREAIIEIINQSLPKSYSYDFQMLEESRIQEENNQDAMDFAKFGLGIDTSGNEQADQGEADFVSDGLLIEVESEQVG